MTSNLLEPKSRQTPVIQCDGRRIGGAEGFLAQTPVTGPLGEFLLDRLAEDFESAKLSKAFRAFYRIRPLLPIAARQLLQRVRNGKQEIPANWYLPTRLLHTIDRLGAPESIWPESFKFAFVLTHDVETQRGMTLIPQLAELEESLGFRSSWNLVPHKYKIDRGLIADLESRGFEIGIHGYNHDGKTFLSQRSFKGRLPSMNRAISDFDAVGFRSPMVHRNLQWMQHLDVEYDSSCFDVDPFQAMPGGIESFWPSICGRFVELPYTLPQDHTLFVTLGETDDSVWQQKLQKIIQCHGMALLLTHPDYLDSPRRLDAYRNFLQHVKETGDFWHALPKQVARYTRHKIESS